MSSYHRKAVALAYGRNPVPVVTAKGEDDLAIQMLALATKRNRHPEVPGSEMVQASVKPRPLA